jgi:hypothetical protein
MIVEKVDFRRTMFGTVVFLKMAITGAIIGLGIRLSIVLSLNGVPTINMLPFLLMLGIAFFALSALFLGANQKWSVHSKTILQVWWAGIAFLAFFF